MAIGPIDYMSAMPQIDLGRNIASGLQLGSAIRQQSQEAAQMQAAAQARAQYQADIAAVSANPTAKGYADLALKYPQQREAYKQAWEQIDEGQRKSQGETAMKTAFALESGNTEVAKKVVQDRITALENSNQDATQEKSILSAIDSNPTAVKGELLRWAAYTQDPTKFVENFAKLGQEDRAKELAPDLVRKGAADANTAVAGAIEKNIGLVAQKAKALARPGVKATQAEAFFRSQARQGLIPENELQGYLDGIPTDSKGVQAYLNQVGASGMSAAEQTKYTDVDANTAANNATSRANTADNNATSRANTAANNATSLQIQDRIAARNPVSANGSKPLPTAALKMQQQDLDALSTATGIDTDLARVEKQIADGKLTFGPISNLINRGKNAAGLSTEGSRNFASFQSTLEKLRNDSLRLNAGVQTDGDAQRAWNELFANINDAGVVKQRLAEIRNINKRGAQLRKLNVDSVRANYGHDGYDFSKYEEAAKSGGEKPNTKPAANKNIVVDF